MTTDAIWITEADVVGLMDLKEAIAALEAALRAEARGEAQNMTKTLLQYGKNNLHAIGGKLDKLVGTKTWTHTQAGTCPLLLLWSAEDGSLVAVIEAFALGNLRTGGISGVAADWMARPDAGVMAIVGAGKQALAQVGTM
ncbi:MAG TPA: ornithine cyclodeaminase family protein, partial [Burkholderiales bacterium]|nr:ornithine cyclodeaminase family protein [Burkholderiales bacterium]